MMKYSITTTHGVFNFIGQKAERYSNSTIIAFYTDVTDELIIFHRDKIVCVLETPINENV